MSHVESGPLAAYSSLQDKHLAGYFNNSRMRRHLRRSGLVTRKGEIITENTFRLNMARKEHQKHVRDLMAQAIVHKALDMERHRQSQIKRKLEEISKVELVQRVRSTRGRKGDEDITPYLSPRAPQGRPKSAKQERPRSVVSGHRPATAPSKQGGATKKKSAVYIDHDGFPVHRDQAWVETASDSNEEGEIDSQNLRELDPYVMNNITLNMSPEDRRSNSPYKVDLTLPPEPKPPTRPPPTGSRKTPRGGTSRTVLTKDGRRLRPKSNKGSLSLHRKEPAYPHAGQQQTLCDVTIKYRGSNLKLQYERQDKRDEIIINQQHCGGGNLVVFHGLVEPGTDLVFTSRRHRGYPFSLTFYLNQIQVLRLSACCEYKYGPGVLLGGRKGHFKFGRVDGGSACYRCMVEAELARRERQRYKDTQTEEPKPEPEPEPILESQGTQSDPPPPETRDQNEQAQADDEAEEAEGGYDDEAFEDEDGKEDGASEKEDASKTGDKNSDHFFSGPESDVEQKQPHDADYDADSDFEVESNHGKRKEEENEQDEEIKEEVKEEEDIKEEVDEEDAVKEASEEEPIQSEIEEADEGNKDDGDVPQEVIKEEDDTHEVPEEKKPQVKEEDKHDDSDLDSDGEDHNKVLSSSSSSSSASEDEADQKVRDTIVSSSSDSDSDDDEERKTKEVEQDKDDIKEEETPSKDEGNGVVREEDDTDKDIQASAEEAFPAKDRNEVERKEEEKRMSPPLRMHLKDVLYLDDEQEEEMQADEQRKVKAKEEQLSSSLPENPEDTNDRKTDQEVDDDIKGENNTSKEKQEEEGEKEESDKEDKSLFDRIKSVFTSSDSDSSDSSSSSSSSSDSDSERKKKKKHRKKKGEAKKEDTPVPAEIKWDSDSDSGKRSQTEKSDSEKEDVKGESKEEEMQDDTIVGDDSIKVDGNMPAEVDHSEDDKEKAEDVITAYEEAETGAVSIMHEEKEDQKSEEPDRDEDSQSQSERLVSDEDKDEDKGDTVSLGKDTSSENRNDGDAQTKDDPEKPESDIEKEDQKSEEPDQDEDSQSQSERLVSDEENNEDKGDTVSLGKDTSSENMDDGDAQTKDDHEQLESDSDKKGAPTVHIEEPTSDAEEQKEEDQDANKVTSEDDEDGDKQAGDSEKGEVDSSKIDEDDEKQTADTEKEDAQDDEAEEDNDDGQHTMSNDEKEADEKQNTTEDEDATEKEEDSKEEAVQGDEDREQKEEEVEVKPDEIKDEDKGEDDKDGPKEEVNQEGSLTSRSSASDSGSIANGLDKNYRILNLNAKNLDERKAEKLAKALKKHKYRNLEYLLLRENSLTDAGLATVIRSLVERHNESTSADSALKLTHLDLGNSGMGDESAAELARLLTLDTPLRNLNISENELSTAAWASIIDHVKTNKSLVTLSAEYAHLSDTSCVMLTEAVTLHEKLEELNIEGNGLGMRAGKAVAQLVKDNSIITTVNFERDNSIEPNILAEVKEILETGSYVP